MVHPRAVCILIILALAACRPAACPPVETRIAVERLDGLMMDCSEARRTNSTNPCEMRDALEELHARITAEDVPECLLALKEAQLALIEARMAEAALIDEGADPAQIDQAHALTERRTELWAARRFEVTELLASMDK